MYNFELESNNDLSVGAYTERNNGPVAMSYQLSISTVSTIDKPQEESSAASLGVILKILLTLAALSLMF